MKNFLKIFWIIALTLVIGFSITGCSNTDEEEEEEEKGGGGSNLDWPADIKALGDARFQPAGVSTGYIKFKSTYLNYANESRPGYLDISDQKQLGVGEYNTGTSHSLVSVSGKTIKLNAGSAGTKTLCTDYTITGSGTSAKITFTGGDPIYEKITDTELSVW